MEIPLVNEEVTHNGLTFEVAGVRVVERSNRDGLSHLQTVLRIEISAVYREPGYVGTTNEDDLGPYC